MLFSNIQLCLEGSAEGPIKVLGPLITQLLVFTSKFNLYGVWSLIGKYGH